VADENTRQRLERFREFQRQQNAAPATRRVSRAESEMPWKELACSLAVDACKEHADWTVHDVLKLAGGLLDLMLLDHHDTAPPATASRTD